MISAQQISGGRAAHGKHQHNSAALSRPVRRAAGNSEFLRALCDACKQSARVFFVRFVPAPLSSAHTVHVFNNERVRRICLTRDVLKLTPKLLLRRV